MPNLTTPFLNLKGQDINEDMKKINEWSVSLIDELKTILCNLDSGNVLEAAKIKAQNIDVSQARIKGAQIQSLTADKLTAGTIDTEIITVEGTNPDDEGRMEITGEKIVFYENGNNMPRIEIGRNDNGKYTFSVRSSDNKQGIYMDENGEVSITGKLNSANGVVSGTAIEVGYGSDPAVKFIKTSGSEGARIYYDDSNDMLVIKANYIKLDGTIWDDSNEVAE